MKQPRPKPHLLISQTPLQSGRDYKVLCGKTVTKAEWVLMWSEVDMGFLDLEDLPKLCRDCIGNSGDTLFEKSYVYGAIDGESAKQGESDV